MTRIQLGILIGGVLERAASLANALSAFIATRICPLDPDVKPEKSCSLCDGGETCKETGLAASESLRNNSANLQHLKISSENREIPNSMDSLILSLLRLEC